MEKASVAALAVTIAFASAFITTLVQVPRDNYQTYDITGCNGELTVLVLDKHTGLVTASRVDPGAPGRSRVTMKVVDEEQRGPRK